MHVIPTFAEEIEVKWTVLRLPPWPRRASIPFEAVLLDLSVLFVFFLHLSDCFAIFHFVPAESEI